MRETIIKIIYKFASYLNENTTNLCYKISHLMMFTKIISAY